MAKTMAGVEPFDRLEEKIKLLVSTIARLKGEHTRLTEENGRLQREVTALEERVTAAETTGSEVSALKEERDLIRTRVGEILAELDTLKL
ncbi:MAG: cell division protein ZapB [Acidobacteria bacterium]|jgi:FtsZ-binding cell division protein ZapB|nr:cell division protein ZapB [Acidobacteriota bacterium]